MNLKQVLLCSTFLLWLGSQAMAATTGFDEQLLSLQTEWAHIHYEMPPADREKAFEALAVTAERMVQAYPQRPEPLIWKGIIVSTWAGARGGLGALGLVKEAKALFEHALEIDPAALSGSACTSLGSLYYQVPGWPIAFGDDKKARALLEQAIQINPDGIDSNYFYADYLMEEGDYRQAKVYFEKAMQAAPRAHRLVADEGRRHEILVKLEQVEKKLK
ncbi:MAG: tetratricopeptide repeat protein [Pseudomonadota bacterium]|nr:tetratricopeptide repeat protein [Pseudomonadota bacterium]